MLEWDETVLGALKEDLGSGDVTTRITIAPEKRARAELLAKEDLVLAGWMSPGAPLPWSIRRRPLFPPAPTGMKS